MHNCHSQKEMEQGVGEKQPRQSEVEAEKNKTMQIVKQALKERRHGKGLQPYETMNSLDLARGLQGATVRIPPL